MIVKFTLASMTESKIESYSSDSFGGDGVIAAVELAGFLNISMSNAIDLFKTGLRMEREIKDEEVCCIDIVREAGKAAGVELVNREGKTIAGSVPYIAIGNTLAEIDDLDISIARLHKLSPLSHEMILCLAFSGSAGEVMRNEGGPYKDTGVTYYFNSGEGNRHNEPHVHLCYRHECMMRYFLRSGVVEPVNGSAPIPNKILKEAKRRIDDNLERLCHYWNDLTDGIRIDLNHEFNKRDIRLVPWTV